MDDKKIDWMLMYRNLVNEYVLYSCFDYPLIDVSTNGCLDFLDKVINPNIELYDPTDYSATDNAGVDDAI